MGELVDKLALRLLELGIGAREFVSCQFPNRWEFAIAHLATIRIGAISSAIMPIYGKREVRFMLERTGRSEEHTSELQSLMRISYAVFCLKKKKDTHDDQMIH